MTVTRETVLTALCRVIDPVTGKNIVETNMVEGLALRDGHVGFAIEVPAARGHDAEPLRKAAEKVVAELPGVLSATVVLTAHHEQAVRRPQAPIQHGHAPQGQAQHGHAQQGQAQHGHAQQGQAQHGHAQQGHAPQATGIPGVAAIIAVASGKGGVGKSTVAVNLALALSKLGLKTGLLDADIYGPSVPRLLDIKEKPRSRDGQKLDPIEKFGLKTMSIGFLVKEDEPMIWRGPMVMSALTQMLGDVTWAPLDVLVVDMPPGTGDAQLTIAQRVPLKGAVIVSTPQDIALIDARKGIAMFQKTQIPILGIVENMSVFVCPECGHESHIFGHGGARETARTLNVPFLGEIPLVPKIRETSDAGTPIVAEAPGSREAEAFMTLARSVAGKIQAAAPPPPRIVME